MSVIESAYKSSIAVKLDAGTNPATGNMIVKSCSLGKIVEGADNDKIMSVVGALLPVLDHSLVRVERTKVTSLEN
ncbi:MAG: DUF1659 domain-containing protein [Synergistaceae bacterium]|jgi:hypothetical protein|nr:DUF1659 domain-containing protein [Synergistaceae bacterium]